MRDSGTLRTTPRGLRDGFVLFAVLSVMALLALMLGVSSLLARGAIETVGVTGDDLREDALLAAGIELAGHQLFALRASPDTVDGQQVRMNDGTLTILVSSEAGKVDLNGSDSEFLASAYRAAGLTALDPGVFAAEVAGWREAAFGGEGDRAPGLPAQSAGAAFRAVGDLRWVPGVGEADAAALAPFVTVFNPSGKVDPLAAPRRLLDVLPGVTPEAADRVAALPAVPARADLFTLRAAFRGLENRLVLGEASRAYAVSVEARLDDRGPVRSVRAVLVAPVTSDRAYHVADWQEQ